MARKRELTITIDGLTFTYSGEKKLGTAIDVEYTAEVCNNLMGCTELDHTNKLTQDHLETVLASEHPGGAKRYEHAKLSSHVMAEGPRIVYSVVDGKMYLRATKNGTNWTLRHA
jgi:hypothetical protein